MSAGQAQWVFKIAAREAWAQACRLGTFGGSADDLRDGYIHLSALPQLRGTLARHFKGQTDLVLIKLDSGALGDALRWEPSRNGDIFPHLYAPLPTTAACAVRPLSIDEKGEPILPEDL
jgi:uncharacterized protein (DUF952 family)